MVYRERPPEEDEPAVLTSCSSPQGAYFRAIALKLRHSDINRKFYELKIQQKPRGEPAYQDLPLTLSVGSYLLRAWRTDWPPETIDSLLWEEDHLRVYYRDEWTPFYNPNFAPGLWRATFLSEKGVWSLYRVRSMDYEHGDDKAPVGGRLTEQSKSGPPGKIS
jgi:hypothetical protein